jgi:hypothetical protein
VIQAGVGDYNASVAPTTDWTLTYVPFCALMPPAADAGAFDPAKFAGLAITLPTSSATPTADIWVDEIYLVK